MNDRSKRIMGFILSLMLIIIGFSVVLTNVNAGTGLITKVSYLSPTQMYTDKGSVAVFGLYIETDPDYDNQKPQLVSYAFLYNWNKTALLTDSSWKLAKYYQNPMGGASTLDKQDTSVPYYLTSSRYYFLQPALKDVKWWWHITVPSTTAVNTTWLKVRINYNDGVSNTSYANYWFKLIINDALQFYNIDLSTTPLPSTIKPETTTNHKLTIYNNGTHLVSVGLKEYTTFEDSDGDSLNASIWGVYFTDALGNEIYYRTIPKASSATCYLKITAPEAADAPAGAELTVKVTASVLNDTRYGETITLGGSDTKTSDDFTGADDDEDWYRDWDFWTSTNMLLVYGLLFIILALALWIGTKSTKKRGRKKKR